MGAAGVVPEGTGATPELEYHGGAIVANPEPYVVRWGAAVDSTVASTAYSFLQDLSTSAYMDWLSQYDSPSQRIGRGAGATDGGTITPSNTSTTLSSAAIGAELNAQIAAGNLLSPDANTIYVVFLPPGVTTTLGSAKSCTDFCGYHTSVANTNSHFGYGTLRYAVIPDMSASTCSCHGTPSILGDNISVTSHEFTETVTDPDNGGGWWDNSSGNEIGDICAWQTGSLAFGVSSQSDFQPQLEWSNASAACLLPSAPAVTAVSPNTGYFGGGGTVTINGSGFSTTGTTFTFVPIGEGAGDIPATNVSCSSSTACTATVPMGSPGTVDIIAGHNTLFSTPTGADQYTYLPPPSCTASSSCAGIIGGPPDIIVTCPSATDFYLGSPGGTYEGTSTQYVGDTSDYAGNVWACVPGTTNSCIAFSTYSPPENWCPIPAPPPGGGGSSGGGGGGPIHRPPKCIGLCQ
jgi:hypothetical protein